LIFNDICIVTRTNNQTRKIKETNEKTEHSIPLLSDQHSPSFPSPHPSQEALEEELLGTPRHLHVPVLLVVSPDETSELDQHIAQQRDAFRQQQRLFQQQQQQPTATTTTHHRNSSATRGLFPNNSDPHEPIENPQRPVSSSEESTNDDDEDLLSPNINPPFAPTNSLHQRQRSATTTTPSASNSQYRPPYPVPSSYVGTTFTTTTDHQPSQLSPLQRRVMEQMRREQRQAEQLQRVEAILAARRANQLDGAGEAMEAGRPPPVAGTRRQRMALRRRQLRQAMVEAATRRGEEVLPPSSEEDDDDDEGDAPQQTRGGGTGANPDNDPDGAPNDAASDARAQRRAERQRWLTRPRHTLQFTPAIVQATVLDSGWLHPVNPTRTVWNWRRWFCLRCSLVQQSVYLDLPRLINAEDGNASPWAEDQNKEKKPNPRNPERPHDMRHVDDIELEDVLSEPPTARHHYNNNNNNNNNAMPGGAAMHDPISGDVTKQRRRDNDDDEANDGTNGSWVRSASAVSPPPTPFRGMNGRDAKTVAPFSLDCVPWLCYCVSTDSAASAETQAAVAMEKKARFVAPRRSRPLNDRFDMSCCECLFPVFHPDLLNYRGRMTESVFTMEYTQSLGSNYNANKKKDPPTAASYENGKSSLLLAQVDTESLRASVRAAATATLAIVTCLDIATCGCPCGPCCYQGLGSSMLGCALRWRVRRAYRIVGDGCTDSIGLCCCPGCMVEQVSAELQSHGIHEPVSALTMV
jgi:hypothetical protein